MIELNRIDVLWNEFIKERNKINVLILKELMNKCFFYDERATIESIEQLFPEWAHIDFTFDEDEVEMSIKELREYVTLKFTDKTRRIGRITEITFEEWKGCK
ncbi:MULTISPECIES: hypothetical protein [Erysipelotrichaceae]|uniref:hypothetical protein n=1 Tax=Erysipelotrichaceae TaxID=128827 RepID=UPI000E556C7D|nr:hypothetical protein [Absiella sp. AM27-20]RHU03307.1 hypothetical protein DW716_15915 [Absiella sp. AM27-20]